MTHLIALAATILAGLAVDRKRWGLALSLSLLALGCFMRVAS